MEQPLVSIIMACYNSIKTIDESISSVINQDYKNFELIIADDNSTDGT
ncbi:glycosyltransferase, partial [Escherichia coli]